MNRAHKASTAALICLALAASGCAPKQRKRAELPPDTSQLEQRLGTLESQVSSMNQEVSRLAQAERSSDDMARRLEVMETRLAVMAEQSVSTSIKDNPLDSLPKAAEAPLSVVERKPPPDAPTAEDPPPAPSAPVSVRERTPDELFRLGLRHYQAGELAAAIEKLSLYLKRSQDKRLGDEALFVIGRAELARGRPLPATESFRQLVAYYPASSRRPEALYWGGESFRRLNDKILALKFWKELEAAYPDHPLALKARQAISEMARER